MTTTGKLKPHLTVRIFTALLILAAIINLCLNETIIRREGPSEQGNRREEWRVVGSSTSSTSFSSPATAAINVTNIWEDSERIPPWMKDYFSWHQETRQNLNETNWDSQHYLLLRCVQADKKCAGASDRLKAIPAVLRMAAEAKPRRLLFLAWSRPAPLEEFLVPPPGGFDWRLPTWLADKVDIELRGPKFSMEGNVDKWSSMPDPIIRMKSLHGAGYYDDLRQPGELTFDEVYPDVWNTVFAPSPPVALRIDQALQQLGLQPQQYVAAHIRSLYRSDTREEQEEVHAVTCASQLGGPAGLPIYVASDSRNTTAQAVAFGISRGAVTVARNDSQPMHLDRGRDFLFPSDDWQGRHASEFYDIFVDLFVLARSRCVAYGSGGYGHWASLLGGSQNCSMYHREANCTWEGREREE